MITQQKQIDLITFFQALDRVVSDHGFDMALVVKKKNQDTKEFLGLLPPERDGIIFTYDETAHPDDALKALLNAFENKKWFFLHVERDNISGRVYNQLRLLASINRIQIAHLIGSEEEVAEKKQPPQSRVVITVTKNTLEKLEHHIMQLFGPIIYI